MEDILGLIIFILAIAFRTMADRKKGMSRGQKGKTITPPPRTRTKPPVQAEPAAPKKLRPVAAKPVPLFPEAPQPAQTAGAIKPPPLLSPLEEGQSHYERIVGSEGRPAARQLEGIKPQPAMAAEGQAASGINYEELRRAVLWSEILGKPRAMRRSIR